MNSKQWLKIKASGKFMERTLEEGLWNRGGCSLLFTEKSPTSRCVFCWLLQFSWGRNHAVSPSCRIPMTCNWRRCAEMHQHSIRDGFLFRWLICIAYSRHFSRGLAIGFWFPEWPQRNSDWVRQRVRSCRGVTLLLEWHPNAVSPVFPWPTAYTAV